MQAFYWGSYTYSLCSAQISFCILCFFCCSVTLPLIIWVQTWINENCSITVGVIALLEVTQSLDWCSNSYSLNSAHVSCFMQALLLVNSIASRYYLRADLQLRKISSVNVCYLCFDGSDACLRLVLLLILSEKCSRCYMRHSALLRLAYRIALSHNVRADLE
jgi:hypothetical protein